MIHRYLYLWIKARQIERFLSKAAHARDVQRAVLFEKLRRNADSGFGREHGFSDIRSVEDFRRRVPVANYEYFRPYVEKVMRGDLRAMFGPGTDVLMFSMTSGTTGKCKYIPITDHFFREYRKSWNLWGLGAFRDHVDLVLKQTLQFSSDWQLARTEAGIPCGNASGLAAETRPRISRPVFILPAVLNKVPSTSHKQYLALRLALPSPRVGMIVTANPLTLLNLALLADERREELIRDLNDGRVSPDIEAPAVVRDALHRRLAQKHPARARELEKIVESTGRLLPKEFWPAMSVLAVWTGGPLKFYLPKVRELYGNVVFRDHGLSASEGRMTTPFADNSCAGVLDYVSNYFEFIPQEEHGREQPTILEAHELERDKNYCILLTTSSGLYRYDIHDVVRCVGFEGECPVLEFLNKGAHFSSMAGEKLSEFQVVEAVRRALGELQLAIEHFTLAPVAGHPAHYTLLLEEPLDDDTSQRLRKRVDACLSDINCEYEDRLATKRLQPVEIRRVPHGTWAGWQQYRITCEGASAEQYKHPFLANSPDFVDRLLKGASQCRTVHDLG